MKTEDFYLEYARVIKMCEGTKVNPWECVKYEENTFVWHPNFGSYGRNFNFYKFAIAILEDKPVFVGDKLYKKHNGDVVEANHAVIMATVTWKKPEPKRTFTLNGEELPCPVKDNFGLSDCRLKFYGKKYYFKNIEDRDNVVNAIKKVLES